ncbi:hypothetical protein [Sulfobacillus thermosulfidooxidans]|uniref:Uncharacterized protein n=1 Tax=Sulfobacillus thermosulfidooxidans (strain DSM 9293 / VKM B-1269 / AT-1) TaxID=929705 RepID=A0A1W1WH76_SULTA|nr:hypothetical protein [Sulfobacillus thermosulfidooxidans]SMC05400.1 hypothetical protein SAMN00768000_2226 [Sulfobacillus thermosulfidooxidans DSM 9293]
MWPKLPQVLSYHPTVATIIGAIIVTTVLFTFLGKWFVRITKMDQDE